MFNRILIANRGEIACRIIRTAHRLGIEAVAVHSDADAESMHVAMADRSIRIGGPPSGSSYLRGDRVIEAALESGAEAIHPGYGFLSEDWNFVADVAKAGLKFVGPSADAVRTASRKDLAKQAMVDAGVPVVPGTGPVGLDEARQAAVRLGYPVFVKAVAGGGGRGMRVIRTEEELPSAFASAAREALAAFGDGTLFVEKLVESPRHIEFQIFGDGFGQHVHLFERDCSLQRRHQKIIEEAPAPGMSAELRNHLGKIAVKAARALAYEGAGTVEFIAEDCGGLDADRFWFIEMNTRLQVEHPVTEAITGLDLVELQLRIAAGEPLPFRQEELQVRGHAFEARLCCEDPADGYRPSVGRIRGLDMPSDVRVDTGVRDGDEVSPHYDSMIAKIIVSAADRDTALVELREALAKTRLSAPLTNIGLLEAISMHRQFLSGTVETGFLEGKLGVGVDDEPPPDAWAAAASAAAAPAAVPWSGFSLWQPLERSARLKFDRESRELIVRDGIDGVEVEVEGHCYRCRESDGRWYLGRIGGNRAAWARGERICVLCDGYWEFTTIDRQTGGDGNAASGDHVETPMPGVLREIRVQPGDHIAAGDIVAVLEAMKMEHLLAAPRAGILLAFAQLSVRPLRLAAGLPKLKQRTGMHPQDKENDRYKTGSGFSCR